MPLNVGVVPLFTVNTKRKKGRENERERVVRWCRRWDFADSIFTHQTELFPVSTWPNSRSHHLTLLLPGPLCFIPSLRSLVLSGRFPFNILDFASPACLVSLLSVYLPLKELTSSPSLLSLEGPRFLLSHRLRPLCERHYAASKQWANIHLSTHVFVYAASQNVSSRADDRAVYTMWVSWFDFWSYVALNIIPKEVPMGVCKTSVFQHLIKAEKCPHLFLVWLRHVCLAAERLYSTFLSTDSDCWEVVVCFWRALDGFLLARQLYSLSAPRRQSWQMCCQSRCLQDLWKIAFMSKPACLEWRYTWKVVEELQGKGLSGIF